MYKTILTHLNSSDSADVITEASAEIAEKHGGHLIGVHHTWHSLTDTGDALDCTEEQQSPSRPLQHADALEQSFAKIASARKLSFEWQHKDLSPSHAAAEIVASALCADLVVDGGYRQSDALGSWYSPAVRIVMEAGRPVLLIPADAKCSSLGKRVTVAWNRTRESARAAFEALPLLKAAESVRLVAINGIATGALSPEDGLPQALERHGIRVNAVSIETEQSPGECLMTELADSRADLLVMGCYGRPRLLEMVLGGMTQHVLAHVQVPVLLAH